MSMLNIPKRNSYKGKSFAVLTSGGDSQGMNAALRACVRMGLYLGCKPNFIKEGYQGMVDGGDNFVPATWFSVSSTIHLAGTLIGSARCEEFRKDSGRLKAAYNLVSNDISSLVVIGGDGSLTGGNLLREEWPDLLNKLVSDGRITAQQQNAHSFLNIVGIVGTIDNDFAGTDLTIGTDSALHRIVETVDAVRNTADSHQRTFIMETMGAHCGYLALMTAIACEADYVFIPESPPPDNWRDELCDKIKQERGSRRRHNLIILSEGALNRQAEPITADMIKEVVKEKLHLDLRHNVLGHMQRGGNPSATDRIIASRMGAEAAVALMQSAAKSIPIVIGIRNNEIVRLPMMESVSHTLEVQQATKQCDWHKVMDIRGPLFQTYYRTIEQLTKPITHNTNYRDTFRLAVVHVGVPACGMNAAVRAFVLGCILDGLVPLAVYNGIEGFLENNIKEMNWSDVCNWVGEGGAHLFSKDTLPQENLPLIAQRLRENNIQGLLLIGGFVAYVACLQMYNARRSHSEFYIPMCVIPATMDNNVPGTDYTLGADTSLNEITEICDRIRMSALGTKNRVFIIETMGDHCGYLATMSGIAGGADAAYIFEEKFDVQTLSKDVTHMKAKIDDDVQRGLILVNENASTNYNTEFIYRMFKEEGQDRFSCRMNVLGHMQQGGIPSPVDRCIGVHFGYISVAWLKGMCSLGDAKDKESACVLGLVNGTFKYTPVIDLVNDVDFENRIYKNPWWLSLRPLLPLLSKHESSYDGLLSEAKSVEKAEQAENEFTIHLRVLNAYKVTEEVDIHF